MHWPPAFGHVRVPPQVDVTVGIAALLFVLHGKLSDFRFRRRSVAVDGVVLKSFPHSHRTSYFVAYSYQGVQRVAEYCGLPLVPELSLGQKVRILIDGTDPPDMEVPETAHNAPGAHAGTCTLEGKPLFSLWEIVFVAGAIALVFWRLREL
jgi:hypothetical protein